MLTIRLQRIGKKGQPSYRLVVAERRSKVGAPPTEDLGAYNPFTKQASFKADRVQHWIGVGAQPTDRVHRFLDAAGILERAPRNNPKKGEPGEAAKERAEEKAAKIAEAEEAAKAAAEAPAEEVAAEEAPAAEEAATEEQAEG